MAGRNDPCPCGSGKKYKKCCMGKAPAGAAQTATAPKNTRQEIDQMLRAAGAQIQAGHLEQAAVIYERILEIRPKHAGALGSLGRIKGELGDRNEAISLFRRAIAVEPKEAILHLALAYLLHETGQVVESIEHAERAARMEPEMIAAHRTLAIAYEHSNRLDKAEASAKRALALDTADPGAKVILARVKRRQKDMDAARRIVEETAGQFDALTIPASVAHELGVVLDKVGEYDGAFEAFVKAGRSHKRSPQGSRLDPEIEIRYIDVMREELRPAHVNRWTREDFDDDVPVPRFLVGFPRSGTTMTEQIMAAHPRLLAIEEKSVTGKIMGAYFRAQKAADKGASMPRMLEGLEIDDARKLRAAYWEMVQSYVDEPIGDRVILDKHPLNIVQLGCVNAIFPEARVIVALRDPRDCCLSCFIQDFSLNPAMANFLSLDGTTRFYAHVMGLWLHMRELLTLDYLEFRYEDTVEDLEKQARSLLEFLGLDWNERVLSFHEIAREKAIATPSYEAVTQKVNRRAIGRWRNYAAHFEPLLEELQPFVDAFGYTDG